MQILNYINSTWEKSSSAETLDVINPATGQVIAKTPFGTKADVESAAKAAREASDGWRRTPVNDRVQYLFKLRNLMRENADEIAKLITNECGKTFEEAKAEMVRAYENIEVACGMPMMIKGEFVEDIATGIDELMIRQPVGVCATIAPFNFPGMILFWYLPYALAAGNTYIVKPSEKVPMTMQFIFKLIEQVGFPKGVVNLVNGAKEVVDGILEHPSIRAVTFVGSTNVAKYIYATAAAHGKRVQAQGGAKNPVIVLPDADMDMATKIIADSAFGCAGQRCLAVSFAVTVGSARSTFTESICDAASSRVVGYGLDSGVQMGPVINAASKARVESLIGLGVKEGA
ncbi:MAG: methylmalonate-semialdehyde dehydrogenase (CoA acylating), partial [Anaerolineae bacterium]